MNPNKDSLSPLGLTFHFDSKERKDSCSSYSPFHCEKAILETRLYPSSNT